MTKRTMMRRLSCYGGDIWTADKDKDIRAELDRLYRIEAAAKAADAGFKANRGWLHYTKSRGGDDRSDAYDVLWPLRDALEAKP